MALYVVSSSVLLLVLTSGALSQFSDFFEALQPFIQTTGRPLTKLHHPTHEETIKRYNNRDNTNKGIIRDDESIRGPQSFGADKGQNIRGATGKRRKQTTETVNFSTTVKPTRKSHRTKSSRNDVNSSFGNPRRNKTEETSANEAYNQQTHGHDIRDPLYGEGNSNIIDYITQPLSSGNIRHNEFIPYTTHNPFYNNPGVKPIIIENRPPITNKPADKSTTIVPLVDKNIDEVVFGSQSTGPELVMGIDDDNMSEAEKRRYIEIAETMCDKYKALNTKQVNAIPLLPSPEPVQLNVSTCSPTLVPLVVGGKVVTIDEYPHMALLGWLKMNTGGYAWRCGGSLISDQFVLTAAHCAYQEKDNSISIGTPRAVQLGSSYLDDPGALVVKVSTVIRHPKYKLPKSYYDLALVKLVSPVRFSDVVRPACLGVPPRAGNSIVATGWGRTEYGREQSHQLRSVSLPIWNIEECSKVLGTSRKLPNGPSSESQMCAGDKRGGKDTCQGDSGGPAQIEDGCVWRIVAVTSLGRTCGAEETPAIYARVQRAFISATVFGSKPNNNNIQQNNSHRNQQNYGYSTQRPINYSSNGNAGNTNRRDRNKDHSNSERYTANQRNENYYNNFPSTADYANSNNFRVKNSQQLNYEDGDRRPWT